MESPKYARKCIYMPSSSGQSQFSIRSFVTLKLKPKKFVCGQSGVVNKLYNQFEVLTVRANDYGTQGG